MQLGALVVDHYHNTDVHESSPAYMNIGVDDTRVVDATRVIIKYSAKFMSAYDFQHQVKDLFPYHRERPSAVQLRKKLVASGKVFLGLRFFVLSLARWLQPKNDQVLKMAAQFKVSEEDALLAAHMYRTDLEFREHIRTEAGNLDEFSTNQFHRIDQLLVKMHPYLVKHARVVFWNKLQFLATFGVDDYRNLLDELYYKAIVTYYSIVPTDMCNKHVLNYLRRSMTNHAYTIIRRATSYKRNAIITKEGKGEKFNEYTTNRVAVKGINPRDDDFNSVQSANGRTIHQELGTQKDENTLQFELFLVNMNDRLRNAPRKRRFLQLLSGWEDENFTRWLRKRHLVRGRSTCVEYMMRVSPEAGIETVRRYCRISRPSCERFLDTLREEMQDSITPTRPMSHF